MNSVPTPKPKPKSELMQALDEVAEQANVPCVAAKWLDSLDAEDRAYVEAQLLVMPKLTVFRAVSKFAECSATSWNRHFNEACSCSKIGTVNA